MFKNIKSKLALLSLGILGFASSASAAVTVDNQTGVMSGSLEMAPFYGAVVVVVTALGAILAVRAGIRMLKSL